jgi:hypothetical protein
MMIFSGNHYALIYLTTSDRPPLTGPTANATADQLRAAWGPLTASSGTFQISGNTLTARPKVAKNPPAMASGAFIENTFTLKGDSLTLTSVKNDQGAIANPLTAHWVRAK